MNKTNEQATADVVAILKAHIEELQYAKELTRGVLDGTPWVIRLAPQTYLVRFEGGYRPGSILSSVCYSPDRIEGALSTVRAHFQFGKAFGDGIQKVLRRDALKQDIDALTALLGRLN